VGGVAFSFGFAWQLKKFQMLMLLQLHKNGEARTWVMNIIWTLGGPANGIRTPKGGQAIQMERVTTVCKPPKNRAVAHINCGYKNWCAARHTPEPVRRWIKRVNIILDMSNKGQVG